MKKLLLLLLIFFLSNSAWATDYCSSSAGCWLFREGSGTTVEDSSPNTNTGNFKSSGNPAWSATIPSGYSNSSVNYASGDYVAFGLGATLQIQKPLTHVVWVKPATISGYPQLYGGGGGSSLFYGLPGEDIAPGGEIRFLKIDIALIGTSTGTVGTSSFSHVSVTYDSSGNFIFYINGVSAGTGTNSQTFTYQAGADIALGVNGYGASLGQPYTGLFNEAGIFSSVLTSTEINDIMTNGLSPSSVAVGSILNDSVWNDTVFK